MLAQNDFARDAQPLIDDLAGRQGVTVTATELDNAGHMVVIALARASVALSIHVTVGSRFPALISASGRCYAALSGWTREELRDRFSPLKWQNAPRFGYWLKEVEAARQDGYAIDRGAYIRGVLIAAAPVFDGDGNATRALAAIGIADQFTGAKETRLARAVKRAAERLSA